MFSMFIRLSFFLALTVTVPKQDDRRDPQDRSKQDGPRSPQEGPKTAQEGPKTAQARGAQETAQESLNRAPREAQGGYTEISNSWGRRRVPKKPPSIPKEEEKPRETPTQ